VRLAALLATATLALSALPQPAAAAPSDAKSAPAASTRAAPRNRLVFFINPHGAPCQMQDKILNEMAGELRARTDVVYYRTTSNEDLQKFQQYGIRSLPQLVLTDATGKELRRATPGVQSTTAVRALVGP
jgi:thioredoxin 1